MPKSGQSIYSGFAGLRTVDHDNLGRPAIALRSFAAKGDEDPGMHSHNNGQLVIAGRGSVICEVPTGYWMVPPQCGVWIPSGVPHCMKANQDTDLCLLLVDPQAARLPAESCTLSITPMLHEMILHLADQSLEQPVSARLAKFVDVLLTELADMQIEQLYVPVSGHKAVRRVANEMLANPGSRKTAKEWADWLAVSERTLTRLIFRETGMAFGRWRQQLQIIVSLKMLHDGAQIQRIAEELGYESVSAFISMFKKALGKSPARYLAAHQVRV